MGIPQRLGTIPLAIFTDASNNIGIGGSPSGSYKFEVTGNIRGTGTAYDLYTSSGLGTSAASGLLRVVTAGTSSGIAVGQANSSRYTSILANEFVVFNDDASIRTNGAFPLSLGTNNTGRLFITSAGNVCIGTSTSSGYGNVNLDLNAGTLPAAYFVIKTSSNSVIAEYALDSGAAYLSTKTAHPIIFRTSDVERMRITSGGRFGFGTTTTDWFFNVVAASGGYISKIQNSRNVSGDVNTLLQLGNNCNNTSSYFLVCTMDLGDRMYIYGNGNVVNINNSYGVLSDVKLKENIVDATPKLENLLKVKIRNYNLIGEETKQIGVVAQELEEIFPSMVEEVEDFKEVEVEDEEGNFKKERQSLGTTTKSVKMSVFVPMLIKAVQELSAKVSALENKS